MSKENKQERFLLASCAYMSLGAFKMVGKILAAAAWFVVVGIGLRSPLAIADSRPGCLPTNSGAITWTLPDTPVGPSWSFVGQGYNIQDVTTSGQFRATIWRRPCSTSDSQVILTLAGVSGSPVFGRVSISQDGAADLSDYMFVNDPTVFGGNLYVLTGATVGTAISGVLDVVATAPATFDPNEGFIFSFTALWPIGNSQVTNTLTVPAYDPSQYGSGVQPPGINLNQRGLSGTWYNPETSGQGFVIDVSPDFYGAGTGLLFAGWYTFEAGSPNGQRWYTLQGQVSSGSSTASIPVYLTQGGNFDAAGNPTTTVVGQSTLTFSDCNHGTLAYTLSDGGGRSGTIPLTRLLPNPTCQ